MATSSRKCCYIGKAISVTYSESFFVAFDIQNYIVICGLSGCTTVFYIIS